MTESLKKGLPMQQTLPDPDCVWVGSHLARRFELDADAWLTWCDTLVPAQQLEAAPDGPRCPTCTVSRHGEIRAESMRQARAALAPLPAVQRRVLPPCPIAAVA